MYNSQVTSERIKQLTRDKNISLLTLNEQCGLSKDTIKTAGKSENGMKAKNLYMIAEFLDVSVDYLLGRTDEPYSNLIKVKEIDNINQQNLDKETIEIAEMIKNNLSLIDRSKVVLFIDKIIKQKEETQQPLQRPDIEISQSPQRAIARNKDNPLREAPTPDQLASLTPVPEDSDL